MSFSSPHDHDRRSNPADPSGAPALHLLDEYWFFSNTLVNKCNAAQKPPLLPRSPSTSTIKPQQGSASRLYSSGCRRLLRTPSLPSPRVGNMETMSTKDEELVVEQEDQQVEVEVDDDDLNWSSIYEGVLRTRMADGGGRSAALQRVPSMPVPSSAVNHHKETAATKSTPSMPRLTHSYSTLDRRCRSHTPTRRRQADESSTRGRCEVRSLSANQQAVVVRSKTAFQDKKWKSSSDLESIEVQGFKDLGFVFDKDELRENLADVLPGLRGKAKASSARAHGVVRRPYLSEAWHHVRRSAPPALIRVQSDARSAAEMKDQLRMWAQAVACNVRQEC